MKNIFKRLLNVKGMVVEDVSIDDSPLRDAPVLVARVRCRKAALRCSRCGRKCPKYDDGGGERRWRHQDFGCYRVELVGPAPRVECRVHGVVVSRVPWAVCFDAPIHCQVFGCVVLGWLLSVSIGWPVARVREGRVRRVRSR